MTRLTESLETKVQTATGILGWSSTESETNRREGDPFRLQEGEISRDAVLEHLNGVPELEALQNDAHASRNFTRRFKNVATGMGIQVNPGRDRYQKVVEGETQDWYRLVRPAQVKVTDEGDDAAPLNGLQQHYKTAADAV